MLGIFYQNVFQKVACQNIIFSVSFRMLYGQKAQCVKSGNTHVDGQLGTAIGKKDQGQGALERRQQTQSWQKKKRHHVGLSSAKGAGKTCSPWVGEIELGVKKAIVSTPLHPLEP